MSDIIRMARAAYGPEFDRLSDEAGAIKAEYVQGGGNPDHVYSPERIEAAMRGGLAGLLSQPAQQRQDGSTAAPYVPTEMALAMNMIERPAIPAVQAALASGINTVSSGVNKDTGRGFAIGRSPSGQVVRVEK